MFKAGGAAFSQLVFGLLCLSPNVLAQSDRIQRITLEQAQSQDQAHAGHSSSSATPAS